MPKTRPGSAEATYGTTKGKEDVIENKPWLWALAGMVRTESGALNWTVIVGSVMTAAIVGLGTATIDQGKLIARLEAQRHVDAERIAALENGNTSATSERYRAGDAQRDFARFDRQHRDDLERVEKRLTELELRIRELERRR
jgi:hypothetical protein